MEPDNPLLDQYIVAQLVRLTLPYAFSLMRRMMQCVNFYKAFSKLKVRANCLSLFTPPTADLESFILEQDVIYVGGGNTKSMLALWREIF